MGLQLERTDYASHPYAERSRDFTVFQSSAWLDFLVETQGGEPVSAVLHEDGTPRGSLTGMIIRKLGLRIFGSPFPGWTTPYMGFNLISHSDLPEALRLLPEFVFKSLHCIHFELMHRGATVSMADDVRMVHRVYSGFEVDLSISEDEIFERMSPACRRCIRKAEKDGIKIKEANTTEFADEYFEQLRRVFKRQRLVPPYGVERIRSLIRHVSPTGRLLLLRAEDASGHCIATGIFPADSQSMYFWGGASLPDERSSRPNEALQWSAIRHWRSRGVMNYDMGGGGEYKRKYGGREIAIPWFRGSRSPIWEALRHAALIAQRSKQQVLGRFNL